jgi:hypothetical protein
MKDALEELKQAKITANEALCIFEEVNFVFILQTNIIIVLFGCFKNANCNFYLLSLCF